MFQTATHPFSFIQLASAKPLDRKLECSRSRRAVYTGHTYILNRITYT